MASPPTSVSGPAIPGSPSPPRRGGTTPAKRARNRDTPAGPKEQGLRGPDHRQPIRGAAPSAPRRSTGSAGEPSSTPSGTGRSPTADARRNPGPRAPSPSPPQTLGSGSGKAR